MTCACCTVLDVSTARAVDHSPFIPQENSALGVAGQK